MIIRPFPSYKYNVKERPRVLKKKRGIKIKLFVAFVVLGAIIAFVVIFINNNVNPMIVSISNEKIRAITTEAVGSAVIDVMAQNTETEYMSIDRSDDKTIKDVEIDAEAVSVLAQKITLEAQKRINAAGEDGIKIPIGSLSGVTLFTGLGPDINIKIYLTGSTQTKITSVFSESGINQTLHRLYLDIDGTVAVAIPGLPSTIKTSTRVLMSEMIILGEVPPTYLKAMSVGDMLDLVVD